MSPYPILVLVGSLRRNSYNRKLANALAKLAPPEFSLRQAQIGDLPLYNQDDDAEPGRVGKAAQGRDHRRQGGSVRDAGI